MKFPFEMKDAIEFVKYIGIAFVVYMFMIRILKKIPALFALAGIFGMGFMNYLAIEHLVETWPPRTFLNGAQIFCFVPFLTVGVFVYIGMLRMAITGELSNGGGTTDNALRSTTKLMIGKKQ